MGKRASSNRARDNSSPPPGEILTGKEVQVMLNISRTTLWKLRKEQGLPYTMIGKKHLYLRTEILEWLRTQRGGSKKQLLLSFGHNVPGDKP